MIKFYNQYILFFLPLSLLPVILHFLFSKKTIKIKFTYTSLIEKILIQNFSKNKIIDIIILFLRCLIIFLLIIYFSRPVMYLNPKQKNLDLIIAIDTSFSVRQKVLNTTKFEILKEKIKNLLKFLKNKNVKIKLLLFDEDIKVLNETFDFSSDELIEKINNIKPSYKSTNIKTLFNYISSFSELDIRRNYYKIIIFTDFAEHILKDSFVSYDINKISREILFCYPEIVSTNIGIESLYLEDKNDDIVINCLYFISGKEIKNFNAKLFIGFKHIDTVNVDIEKKKFVFNYLSNEKNFFGKILLPNDSLIEDNEFYFLNNISNNEEVFCFIKEREYYTGFKSKKFYFEKLNIPRISFKIVSSEENLKNKNLIIVDEEKINDLLSSFSFDNKLVIFPKEKIDYEDYEEFLKEIEIIEFQKDNPNPYSITLAESSEFNEYFNRFDYEKIWVKNKFLINIEKNSSWITLLKFNDGKPALIKKNGIFFFTFPIDQSNTNLLYKPIFLGLLKFIFLEKKQNLNKNYYFISDKISLLDDKIIKINNFITTTYNIEDSYSYEDNSIIFNIPGVYEVFLESKNKLYVAVNINPEEGKVDLIEKNRIKDYIKNINLSFLNTQKTSFEKELYNWCIGKEYSQNVMYFIILFFIIETLLSRIVYKRLI